MANPAETIEQDIEQAAVGAEVSEVYETMSNEVERAQQSTQLEVETQQSAEKLKQNISKEYFCSYMNDKGTPLESQSQEIQDLTQQILWPKEETELTTEQKKYNEIRSELIDGIKTTNISKIVSSVKKLLKEFLGSFTRKLNIGGNVNYTPNEGDRDYLINAISATLDPEKRSHLTYLLGKIKDEENKEKLREKGIENPSQFQLFLQNCKPGQLILTNGDSTGAKWQSTFLKATQIVSGSRWCHAAVISDIKEEDGVIVDATLVQSTGKGIKEVSLTDYAKAEYKSSDFLLGTFQPPEKGDEVVNKCRGYIGGKYSQINLVADTIFNNVDRFHIHKQDKDKYCSELVFTGMQEAGLELPNPHTTPADLLSTNAVTPEYCCYCDSF